MSDSKLLTTVALGLFPICALGATIVVWLFSFRKEE